MHKKPLLTLLSSAAIAVAAGLSVPAGDLSAATTSGARQSFSSAAAGVARKDAGRSANNKIYIVRMADAPVASYDGRVRGYAATRPAAGAKIDASNPDTQNYRRYLNSRHDEAIQRVGGRKVYSYDLVFNGFAAELTDAQAAKLASTPGVLSVTKDEMRYADTSSTPKFLGLTDRGGLWDQLGGARNAGDGIVVGIIDSGIWPENPSFANTDRHPRWHGGHHDHHRGEDHGWHHGDDHIRGWTGYCEDGEQFVGDEVCNGKIIGARYFNESWGGDAALKALRPWEFMSPRDYNGHGSHTSSTAAGNYKTKVDGPPASLGPISGMAPGARIAVYKALWSTESGDTASGSTSDLVAAIDQAVADGVDVINYSISGSSTNFRDPVEISFLYAADAGVFVAASAGNSGPTASTVAHPSPWITTVAAGTHNRAIQGGSVTLGNGSTYTGTGYLLTAGPVPLVDAGAAGLAGADPATLALCLGTSDDGVARLDPAKVAGKIVVCNRGTNVLVNKAQAVKDAGGAGMVLVNTPTSNTTLPFVAYSIPAVHLPVANYADLKAYAATATPTATINSADVIYTAPAPFTASFSSRGPLSASFDLLKPDLMAPGQDILAAVSPAIGGLNFDLYSGTSMSSPHIAGLAALFKDKYPRWSPMMIKSALMTTAYDVLDGPGTNPAVAFSQGAGHVAPNKAVDPGLVFDSGWNDWLGFLCGTQLPTSFCTGSGVPVLDPSDFNGPSIAIGDLAGAQTVTRTLTNVDGRGTYNATVTGLAGLSVAVTPSTFTINPNKKQKVSIKISNVSAPVNAYVSGFITWSDGRHKVRIPVVVKPVALGAPAAVNGSYSVTFGYDGPFSATARGLVPATTFTDTVAINDYNVYTITVPAGNTYARFSLFDANSTPGSDLDLEVYNSAFALIGSSGGSTAAEEVSFRNLAAGTYYVLVVGYAAPAPATSADYTLFTWLLDSTDAGNMAVAAPATATLGATGNIGLSFTGLTSGVKYLGSVAYGGTTGMPNPTIVRVDP
jgi:hypothetical protein